MEIKEEYKLVTTFGEFTPEQWERHKREEQRVKDLNAQIIAEHGDAWGKYDGVIVTLKTGLKVHFRMEEAMNIVNGTTTVWQTVESIEGNNKTFVEWLNSELEERRRENA